MSLEFGFVLSVQGIVHGAPDGLVVKTPPANAGDLVRSLDWEDSLEKEMATHSSVLAWRNPWTEEPDGLQSMGLQSGTQLSL